MLTYIVIDDYQMAGRTIELLIGQKRPQTKYLGQAIAAEPGLEMILEKRPSLAFIDIRMPGMSGLELFVLLKEKLIGTKVVFITAYDDFDFIQTALRLGAYDYLLKPVNPDDLLRIIDTLENEISHSVPSDSSGTKDDTLLLGLQNKLIQEITGGEKAPVRQALFHYWNQLCLDTQLMIPHIEVYITNFTNEVLNLNKQEDCLLDQSKKEMIVYCARNLTASLKNGQLFEIEIAFYEFVTCCANIYDDLLYSSGTVQIMRAKELIDENIHTTITLNTIAAEIFISPFYLSKLFKRCTGINFLEYVLQCRIDKAKYFLMTTEKTIEEIAFSVGYEEPNSFRRLFKKKVGMSPNNYRKHIRLSATK